MLHLPGIVDAAEASPAAAAEAARQIRKFLRSDNSVRPHVQYNAIMLMRILADNPGPTFTKNIDDKFVQTVVLLLRQSRDPSVQQIMRETLNAMELEKSGDHNLAKLFRAWRTEKAGAPNLQYARVDGRAHASSNFSRYNQGASVNPHQQASVNPHQQAAILESIQRQNNYSTNLPPPVELVGRVEEARSSAKLLIQLVQSTPAAELSSNDLIKEFAERCQSANRNLQGYMNSTNPPPDEDTLLTLIETCEQLNLASSKHQRALLAARRDVHVPASAGVATLASASSSNNISASQNIGPPRPPAALQERLSYRTDAPAATAGIVPRSPPPVPNPFTDDHQVDAPPVAQQSSSSSRPQLLHSSPSPPPPPPSTNERGYGEYAQPTSQDSFELPGSPTTPALNAMYAPPASESNLAHELMSPPAAAYELPSDNPMHGSDQPVSPISPIADNGVAKRSMPLPYPTSTHPAFRAELQSTPSYMARQSDAVRHHVMSGAVVPTPSSIPQTRTPPGNGSSSRTGHNQSGHAWGEGTPTPSTERSKGFAFRGMGRVKDDDPVSELEAPQSPPTVGWRHRS